MAITVQATYGWRTTVRLLILAGKESAVLFFRPILEKEQGGYVALLDRSWLQPGWFMTGLKRKSQAGKGGIMEGG